MQIRAELAADRQGIHRLLRTAFETEAEARLVDSLRASSTPLVSLVAVENEQIIGYILFSPVTLAEIQDAPAMAGLAPMAVLPDYQRQGVGSSLVTAGLAACRAAGYRALVVLGHPAYYPRFGFKPASRFALRSEYDVPDEVFMALELVAGALQGIDGTVRFHPLFGEV